MGLGIGLGVGVLIRLIEGGALGPHLTRGAAAGTLIGLMVGAGEEVVFFGGRKYRGYRSITLLRIIGYACVVVAVLVTVNSWLGDQGGVATFVDNALGYTRGPTFVRDVFLAIVLSAAGTAFLEVRRLHNPGEIRRFLLGRYRVPEEEERAFLFVDLKDSTSLAEALGPEKYSRFLGACYRDLAEPILAWRGEVYQYVGDEVVVSWRIGPKVRPDVAIHCFLEMQAILMARADAYRSRFGVAPTFRAGAHAGPIVTTWVGLAKIELAFHGDTLNAGSRILSACKDHDADFLVSSAVLDPTSSNNSVAYGTSSVGEVALRGRSEGLELFTIVR